MVRFFISFTPCDDLHRAADIKHILSLVAWSFPLNPRYGIPPEASSFLFLKIE